MTAAEVAELVDALRSGRSGGSPVGVRVSPSAPEVSHQEPWRSRHGFWLFRKGVGRPGLATFKVSAARPASDFPGPPPTGTICLSRRLAPRPRLESRGRPTKRTASPPSGAATHRGRGPSWRNPATRWPPRGTPGSPRSGRRIARGPSDHRNRSSKTSDLACFSRSAIRAMKVSRCFSWRSICRMRSLTSSKGWTTVLWGPPLRM